MTFERAWAEWAATVDVAQAALSRALAQDALLDITACMIGGAVEPSARAALDVARRFGQGTALAMGSCEWLPAPWAAFVSGTAAHALDFDDNFAPAVTHATAVLAPALFALANEESFSGADLLDAYIIGLELQAQVGRLVNPAHYEKGWHATATVGAIGTAAGCARLLHLNADQVLAAMSIAFSMAGGSKRQFGSMMKPIHAGPAAKNAVLAARMAQAGITGDAQPLSGRWGFMELLGGKERDTVQVAIDRPVSLAIETHGLLAKRYPCCGAAHRTLDGLARLRELHQIPLDAIERVEAFIPLFARENLRFDEPRNEMEARFSLTYCAMRVLQTGTLSLGDITREKVLEESIRPWLRRIVIHTKPGSVCDELGADATPAITRIVLKSGRMHEIGIRAPKGSLQMPLSDGEKRGKFRDCCRWAGKEHHADQLFEAARSIHESRRFTDFSHALAQRCQANALEPHEH